MRHVLSALVALLTLLLLSACGTPQPPTPAVGPAPVVAPLLPPGQSALVSPWVWSKGGTPEGQAAFAKVLATFTTPMDIDRWLGENIPWADDYNTSVFLSPAETVARGKRGVVCSAFAYFWCESLTAQGYRPDFVAFWGPVSAHAVCVFRDKDGQFKQASNQNLYTKPSQMLGYERDAALVGAAQEFYGAQWTRILVYDPDSGRIRQEITNAAAPVGPSVPGAAPAGRNLFAIRR